MQSAGLNHTQLCIDGLHKAVTVGVLALPCIAALTDDKAHGRGVCICVDGSHHLAVLLRKGSRTGDGSPGEQVPLVVGTVFPAVMELELHRAGFLSGNADNAGNHDKTQNHNQRQQETDCLFHDDPPIQFSSYVSINTYTSIINWKRLICKRFHIGNRKFHVVYKNAVLYFCEMTIRYGKKREAMYALASPV